jgi:hypothetical protein
VIGAVVLGAIADAIDLRTALYVAATSAGAGLVLAMMLPSSRPNRRLAPEPVVP